MIETTIQIPSKTILESLLGTEEAQILHVIKRGYRDIISVHLLTGIPEICVRNKVKALVGLGLLEDTTDGLLISEQSELFTKN